MFFLGLVIGVCFFVYMYYTNEQFKRDVSTKKFKAWAGFIGALLFVIIVGGMVKTHFWITRFGETGVP